MQNKRVCRQCNTAPLLHIIYTTVPHMATQTSFDVLDYWHSLLSHLPHAPHVPAPAPLRRHSVFLEASTFLMPHVPRLVAASPLHQGNSWTLSLSSNINAISLCQPWWADTHWNGGGGWGGGFGPAGGGGGGPPPYIFCVQVHVWWWAFDTALCGNTPSPDNWGRGRASCLGLASGNQVFRCDRIHPPGFHC